MLFRNVHAYKPIPSSNDWSTFEPQSKEDNSIFSLPRKAGHNFTLLFRFKEDILVDEEQNEEQNIRYGVRKPTNPFSLLAKLEKSHWLVVSSGCFALFADFLDFGVLAVGMKKIAIDYQTTKARVSDSITYTMALRIVGAIIFGILGDLYGRRWPLIVNLVWLGCLQIGSIYCTSINIFIGIRALFGIAMGGIYSNAISAIYDSVQPELRGLVGAIYQSSAACSGLLAAGLNMIFGADAKSWKKMFWVSAGISFLAAFIRALVPESPQFVESIEKMKENETNEEGSNHFNNIKPKTKAKAKAKQFFKELHSMFMLHWQTFIYCALFVGLISWAAHSFDDNYVTFLLSGKGIDNRKASIITMITKTGSILGQIIIGWLGEFIGRRRVAVIGTLMAMLLLPAALLPSSILGLSIGGWFFQFFLHSYGCVIAAHINELAPKAFRSVLPGVSYQLGTTISAPAAMIVNVLAEKSHIHLNDGKLVEAYQPVMLIIVEICFFFMIILAIFGPERRGVDLKHFKPAGLSESESRIRLDEFKNIDSTQTQMNNKPEFE